MPFDPQEEMLLRMRNTPPGMRIRPDQDPALWRESARPQLAKLLGLPAERAEDEMTVEWRRERDGYTETRFTFHSEAHVTVPCHLLVPQSGDRRSFPLMICLQGHSTGMHVSLGRPLYPKDAEDIAGDRDFALQAVRRQFAALTIEQRGFGECGGTPKGPECYQIAVQALLLGRTLLGERCWDISRAIDVVEKAFPFVDTGRIGIMGNSGGGTASLYAAAIEPRISAVICSCAFSGFLASIAVRRHCICNYVPGIMNWFDMGDIAGLVAPRPLVIVSGKEDQIFPLAGACEQFETARRYYERCGCPDRVRHVIGPYGHRFYSDLGWDAFAGVTGW